MEIEEIYMNLIKTRDEIVNLRGEFKCDYKSWKCTDCKYYTVCISLGIASTALNLAVFNIETT